MKFLGVDFSETMLDLAKSRVGKPTKGQKVKLALVDLGNKHSVKGFFEDDNKVEGYVRLFVER
jgi:hypothetical protein